MEEILDLASTDLTEGQAEKVAEIIATGAEVQVVRCLRCRHILIRAKSILAEHGHTCADEKTFRAHALEMAEVPAGFVPYLDVYKIACQEAQNCEVSFWRACGTDAGRKSVKYPECVVVYVGGKKYISSAATQLILDGKFAKNPPSRDRTSKTYVGDRNKVR
jgi:hypothetical protein